MEVVLYHYLFKKMTINTHIIIETKSDELFIIGSDKQNPLDDLILSKGVLSIDNLGFGISLAEVKSIECWDGDKNKEIAHIKFI